MRRRARGGQRGGRARPLLDAARLTPATIAEELGGLPPGRRHAAELAADALHQAIGAACGAGAPALAPSRSRTLVAMSGGVDSAVAAHLALERGDDVVAVTVELWSDPAGDGTLSCCSPQAVVHARALAHAMGLPHVTLDLRDDFRRHVVDDFVDGHSAGTTPNPCVRCNGLVRFDAMLALAERSGAGTLVTGHYARIEQDDQGPLLARAADGTKDQIYMLAGLDPVQLARVRFPLGDLTKPEVRELAREAGLHVADKRESQDLCFLAGTSRERFLARHGGQARRPGQIVDREGRVLGAHDGGVRFTVGQRRGLGVAAADPLYVLSTDAGTNRVVVGTRDELVTRRVDVTPATLYRDGARVDRVKLRYRSSTVACRIESAGEGVVIELDEDVHGVAPGQTACFLEGDRVVGYGTIASAS
jgi:tRNA-specific 2-thiouridylase